ncbi:hypothetical protein ABZ319_22945 [Nocardia sp. NPDC005978]|uniref:hypothetical protein n=1 Tax=Nocardia sp. NPDC005978 TaxID=3156725 RepID=UPI0033AA1BC8
MNAATDQPPTFENSPGLWGLIRDLFGDNPWVILLAGLLSWTILIVATHRAATQGTSTVTALRTGPRRLRAALRLLSAALLLCLPAAWLVTTVIWGNYLMYVATHYFVDTPAKPPSWLSLTPGSAVSAGYAVLVCALTTAAFLSAAKSEALSTAAFLGAWPALPAAVLTLTHRTTPAPAWTTPSAALFVTGYLLAPIAVTLCLRLCASKT